MAGSSARMLALLSLLQAPRRWPGAVLADRLGVTPRTVRRDVDRLRELGYRIDGDKGPDGGYRLAAGSDLPPLLFDDAQAVAIAVALRHAPASGVEVDEGAARALATVRQVMPSRLRHRVDGIRFASSGADVRVDPAVLEAASAAAAERRVLRFDYSGGDETRRTEPHAVVARGGRWYLVAWDLDRDDWRLFRLDRMRPRTPTGPGFTPRRLPASDAQTFVAARNKGAMTEDRWPCTGVVVVDRPARDLAAWVEDDDLEQLADGTCRIRIGSWSWTGVLAAVARFDAPFTIVAPDALRRAATTLAERLSSAVG
ncbi:transcriptional regulator [Microbacterium resistens]|uniref:Transcriptional regulator n=1 Tax=Microbacterium resistens TaxID=156977 RepID=A0ABY3RRE1_9MICO|nr:transcriptional regulator [Microbacterium resistens]UGS25455.1 transcriptional regulator [Microbacterium resistens]